MSGGAGSNRKWMDRQAEITGGSCTLMDSGRNPIAAFTLLHPPTLQPCLPNPVK